MTSIPTVVQHKIHINKMVSHYAVLGSFMLSLALGSSSKNNSDITDILSSLEDGQQKILNQLDQVREETEKQRKHQTQLEVHLAELVQEMKSKQLCESSQEMSEYIEVTCNCSQLQTRISGLEEEIKALKTTLESRETTTLPSTTETAFVLQSPSACGTMAVADMEDRAPNGWTLCYISINQHPHLRNKECRQLLSNMVHPTSGHRYTDSQDLLNAGGNFGCWRGMKGIKSDIHSACSAHYQHSGKLIDCPRCDIFGVCIRYP